MQMTSNIQNREEFLKRFERFTETPLLILVLIMMGTLTIPLVTPLPPSTYYTLEVIDIVIWAIFALELAIRTYLAPQKISYLKKNWLDVLVVILPVLRIFRGARVLRFIRLTRILTFFGKFTHQIKQVLSRYYFQYLLAILLGLIVVGGILIYNFDKELVGDSVNLADALWLAIVVTISGGYAESVPIGPEAKAVSIFLIIIGTVLVSYFTALLASYFTEKEQDVEQERIEKKLDTLIKEVKELSQAKKQ